MPYVPYKEHDVMEHGIYAADFEAGEEVIATEKIHGSQGVWFVYQEDGFKHAVSSKGNLGESRCLICEEDNHLWKAALRSQLFTLLAENFPQAQYIQAIGEEFPCQKGNWKYGETQPCLRLFKLLVDEKVLTLEEVPAPLRHLWVPVIYRGPYDLVKLNTLRGGREQVSGKELHIREGIVVEPIKERRAKDGIRLTVKMLNPDYKETGEEIS
jgi:RNA ligase (TIGR02306 family)